MRVINVIPSAAGERALAPAGNSNTGIFQSSSDASESCVAFHLHNSNDS